jgi:hypothetical protein
MTQVSFRQHPPMADGAWLMALTRASAISYLPSAMSRPRQLSSL